MSKKAEKNLARLGLAQELLKKKKLPKISAPDMLAGVESRNRSLFVKGQREGPMFELPGGSGNVIKAAVKKKSKKDVGAKKGKFIVCPQKREIKIKKTRLT